MSEQTQRTEGQTPGKDQLRIIDIKAQKIQLAKEVFEAIFSQSEHPAERENRIIFITSFGIVTSDPASVECPEAHTMVLDSLMGRIDEAAAKLAQENPEAEIANIGSYIRVKHAVVRSFEGNEILKTGELVVFVDSIHALAFGRTQTT